MFFHLLQHLLAAYSLVVMRIFIEMLLDWQCRVHIKFHFLLVEAEPKGVSLFLIGHFIWLFAHACLLQSEAALIPTVKSLEEAFSLCDVGLVVWVACLRLYTLFIEDIEVLREDLFSFLAELISKRVLLFKRRAWLISRWAPIDIGRLMTITDT